MFRFRWCCFGYFEGSRELNLVSNFNLTPLLAGLNFLCRNFSEIWMRLEMKLDHKFIQISIFCSLELSTCLSSWCPIIQPLIQKYLHCCVFSMYWYEIWLTLLRWRSWTAWWYICLLDFCRCHIILLSTILFFRCWINILIAPFWLLLVGSYFSTNQDGKNLCFSCSRLPPFFSGS